MTVPLIDVSEPITAGPVARLRYTYTFCGSRLVLLLYIKKNNKY